MVHRFSERLARVATRLRSKHYYAAQYQEMHANGAFPGKSWQHHVDTLMRVIPDVAEKTVLDFGCGPLGGLAARLGERVISYDPYVEKYATPPWDERFDGVFSSDVLEHMTGRQIDEFLTRVATAAPDFVFLNGSTRSAFKNLPNGANAHLTVKPGEWWLSYTSGKLGQRYNPLLAQVDLVSREVTLCFRRTPTDDRESLTADRGLNRMAT